MTGPLKLGLGVSALLHAGVLAGWPVTKPTAYDVERAASSVELYLAAPAPQPVEEGPAPVATTPPRPQPSAASQGAMTRTPPGYLKNPAPIYPAIARARGDEGTVVLEVEVLPSGRCGRLNILSSSGHAVLDDAAAAAVRRWVFRPARRWQQPVSFWVEIPITFRLIDDGTP